MPAPLIDYPLRLSIVAPDQARFEALRAALEADFNTLRARDPYFVPWVRYDEAERRVDLGYELDLLFGLIPPGGETEKVLPFHGTERFFTDNPTNSYVYRDFMLTRHGGNLVQARNELVAEAEARFAALPPAADSPGMNGISPHQALQAMLAQGKGVAIGESHTECSARLLLRQALEAFKAAGGTMIFIESQRSTLNPLLDAYFNDPDRPLPVEIQVQFENAMARVKKHIDPNAAIDREGYDLRDTLKEAKRLGLRVYGLGSEEAFLANPYIRKRPEEISLEAKRAYFYGRATTFAGHACRVIEEKVGDGDKFLTFTGAGHAAAMTMKYYDPPVPGLDRLLGIPSLVVQDMQPGMVPHLETRAARDEAMRPYINVDADVICWADPVVLQAMSPRQDSSAGRANG